MVGLGAGLPPLARKIRIEYAGSVYHVMALGNPGRNLYADDRDRKLWLETLGEACEKAGWRIHAWVIMNNRGSATRAACDRASVGKPRAATRRAPGLRGVL